MNISETKGYKMLPLERRGFLGLVGLGGATLVLASCAAEAADPVAGASMGVTAEPKTLTGTVTYWNQFTSDAEREGFESVTDGFAAAYPGISLEVEALPQADLMTKFTTGAQSGNLPDTVMVTVANLGDMVAMNGLVDLTEPIAAWPGSKDVDPKILSAFVQDGKNWGIPCLLFVDWMYYRADWLEEAGISEPPRTWDEFRSVAKAITDPAKGRHGFGMRGGSGGGFLCMNMLRGFNGSFVDADGNPTLDEKAVVTALYEYTAPYLEDKSVPLSAPADGYGQIMQSFQTGLTGMMFHHTGSLNSITDALKSGEVMTAPLPKAVHELGFIQPLGNGMSSPDNYDSSLAWLEYWGAGEAQADFLESTGYFPASKAAQTDPRITGNRMFDGAIEAMNIGVVPEIWQGSSAWKDTLLTQVQSIMIGTSTVDEAAEIVFDDFYSKF